MDAKHDARLTFGDWASRVKGLLSGKAQAKNYTKQDIDGPNVLYEFVADTVGGPHHAAGEVIYKVRRFMATGNIEDIDKAAAWCYLIAKYDEAGKSRRGDRA